MFVELLLLILVLVAAIAVALRFRGKVDDNKSPPPIDPWANASKKRASSQRPFDQKTSHSLAKPREISGPARIVDGDTIVIKKTQIRLFGIDAPELDHPYGQKAKWALVALCNGKHVRAEITDEDEYGRTVAKCFLPDGHDLSAEMVKQGLAIDWPKFSGGIYASLEIAGVRKKLWLADARQKGRMHVWKQYESRQAAKKS